MPIGSTITYYMKINNILGIAKFKWQIIKQFDMNWASDCIRLYRFVCRFLSRKKKRTLHNYRVCQTPQQLDI